MDETPLTTENSLSEESPRNRMLPVRDFYLLPLLSLLTIVVLFAASEGLARSFWPEHSGDRCLMHDDQLGLRFCFNCTSTQQIPEGPWVENYYNECGYHTHESCLKKPVGSIRVAVLGASSSYGYGNRYEETYTTLASNELSKSCHKHVEFQNLGVPSTPLNNAYKRLDETLRLKPDMIFLVIEPYDILRGIGNDEEPNNAQANAAAVPAPKNKLTVITSLKSALIEKIRSSRAFLVILHYMYQNPELDLRLYLELGNRESSLVKPYSQTWQKRFIEFDRLLDFMSKKTESASVPLGVVLEPSMIQAVLVNTPHTAVIDPYDFGRTIEEIAGRYHVTVINTLPGFVRATKPMEQFYVVDEHLSKDGERSVAEALVKQLIANRQEPFQGCDAH
jgi:hypothetical protein